LRTEPVSGVIIVDGDFNTLSRIVAYPDDNNYVRGLYRTIYRYIKNITPWRSAQLTYPGMFEYESVQALPYSLSRSVRRSMPADSNERCELSQ
jgi:hypothetical protein